jgi:hypothetical protein
LGLLCWGPSYKADGYIFATFYTVKKKQYNREKGGKDASATFIIYVE